MTEEVKEQTKKVIVQMFANLDAAGVVLTLPDGTKALPLAYVEELLLATIEQAATEFTGQINTAFDQLDKDLTEAFKPTK